MRWNPIHPRHGIVSQMPWTSGQEEDEERRDHREGEQRRQVGERQEARDDAGQNERARRPPACGPDQQRDGEHRDRQAVQVRALRHQEREVRVVEPDVEVGLRRTVPRCVDQRPEQVVARVDARDRRDPAQAGPEQEQDHREGRDRAHAAQAAGERVEAQGDEDREHEAVEGQH
jgi:hypothetical protein